MASVKLFIIMLNIYFNSAQTVLMFMNRDNSNKKSLHEHSQNHYEGHNLYIGISIGTESQLNLLLLLSDFQKIQESTAVFRQSGLCEKSSSVR